MLETLFKIFLRDLKIRFYKHNEKVFKSLHYVTAYAEKVLKNNFVYVEFLHANFPDQIRPKPLTNQRDFYLKYIRHILY